MHETLTEKLFSLITAGFWGLAVFSTCFYVGMIKQGWSPFTFVMLSLTTACTFMAMFMPMLNLADFCGDVDAFDGTTLRQLRIARGIGLFILGALTFTTMVAAVYAPTPFDFIATTMLGAPPSLYMGFRVILDNLTRRAERDYLLRAAEISNRKLSHSW